MIKTFKGDIINAVAIEKNYIDNNLGTETDLLTLLTPCNYTNLDDFFGDKFLYQLQQENLQIEHFELDKVQAAIQESFDSGNSRIFAINEDCTWAWIGSEEIDEEKAKELNVKLCPLYYRGGTIITDNNDFNISVNLPTPKFRVIAFKFLEEFNNYLCEKGHNTHIDKNDILTEDNKKVAGSSFMGGTKSGNFSISIALSDHTELIKQLCKKEMIKVPGYLSGITKQEIEEEFTKWLQHT